MTIPFVMKHFAIAILIGSLNVVSSLANATHESHICQTCIRLRTLAAAAAAGDSDYRKYAPDRKVDIERVTLEITPYFEERRIEGVATIRFAPIAYPLSTLQLDGRDLLVHGTESDHPVADFENTDEELIFTFDPPIEPNQKAFVTIHYEANPQSGLYFRSAEMGYPADEAHLFTQGEPEDHQHWFPSHDYPNEKFSTEVICHAPEGMTALSNGRLIDESPGDDGRVRYHWLQEQPHVNYLVSLIVGYFAKEEDQYRDIPLAFYVPPSEAPQIANSFQDTRGIMDFFEQEIGVPYPWDKYFNVCVYDYMFGGMENTSLTTLTSGTLFPDSYENLKSSRGLDAHELAHQWFGDLVTCKDWSHLWLNEGFATYYSLLYDRHAVGEDQFRYGLYRNAQGVLNNREDTTPIVYNAYNAPLDQFSFRAYPKGGWVLHMLRSELGEDIYRESVQTYLERHRYESVASEALINVFEEVSGRSLGRFFDQWVFLSGAPELNVRYRWDATAKRARVQITQTQTINEKRPLFHFPLRLRFWVDGEPIDHVALIKEKDEDFAFRLPSQPDLLRIDPDVELLAKVSFSPSRSALDAQLKLEDDVIGRILAVQGLGQKKDEPSVASLKTVLWEDSFYAVSIEAVKALAGMNRDDAKEVIRSAGRHPDARVRREVARALDKDYSRETLALLKNLAEQERNPGVRSVLVRALGKYPVETIADSLLTWMSADSYHNEVGAAAIAAMGTTGDSRFVEPLRLFIRSHADRFQSNQLGAALQTLATLNRGEEDREATLELVLSYLEDPRDRVRNGAIRALGALGDRRARGPLSALSRADGDPGAQAASSALNQLDETLKIATPSALRQETMDLRDQLRSLNSQIADLERQVREAAEDSAATED